MKLNFLERLQKSPNQHPNTPETQRLQAEIHALKQRLQETGARGDNELEQWRKVVEQEKNRADQAEKAATEIHKHVQVYFEWRSFRSESHAELFARHWRNNCKPNNNKCNKWLTPCKNNRINSNNSPTTPNNIPKKWRN